MSTPSTQVLDPGFTFEQLSEAYEGAGWRVVEQTSVPILAGEPELAVLEQGGQRVVYTFNPVCALRVLDITGVRDPRTLPTSPSAGPELVREWLAADEERTVLRGVLAAAELHDPALAVAVEAHVQHPREAVAAAAVRAAIRLAPGDQESVGQLEADLAQAEALVAVEALRNQLEPMLRAVAQDRSGRLVEELRPLPGDVELTFVPEAVDAARAAYDRLWSQPVRLAPASADARLICHVAPAGMLTNDNELSHGFPSGYRAVAGLLHPQRVWVAWKLVPPGASAGMAYDGLVWLADHWAWFPKPYRALVDLAGGSTTQG